MTTADLPQGTHYAHTPPPSAVPVGAADAIRIEDLQIDPQQTSPRKTGPTGRQGQVSGHRIGPISAAVPRGGYHIITGPNGAGKSLLVAVIALTTPPAAGGLWILGQEVTGPEVTGRHSRSGDSTNRAARKALRRRIGTVFQQLTPLPASTVLDTVLLPVRLIDGTGIDNADIERTDIRVGSPPARPATAARELLHWVGLGGREGDRADSLSGGESRCLALARALISRPEILIADDPTRGLDERAAWRMMGLIEQLHRQGTTIIVATNDPAIVQSQAHPVTDLGGRGRRTVPSENV